MSYASLRRLQFHCFKQGVLPVLSQLPANCPICVLLGSMLFQTASLGKKDMRSPIIFHGYLGCKQKWGRALKDLAGAGMVPLIAALLGSDEWFLLWQSPSGCSFVVGNKLTTKGWQGGLPAEQLRAITAVGHRQTAMVEASLFTLAACQYSIAQGGAGAASFANRRMLS